VGGGGGVPRPPPPKTLWGFPAVGCCCFGPVFGGRGSPPPSPQTNAEVISWPMLGPSQTLKCKMAPCLTVRPCKGLIRNHGFGAPGPPPPPPSGTRTGFGGPSYASEHRFRGPLQGFGPLWPCRGPIQGRSFLTMAPHPRGIPPPGTLVWLAYGRFLYQRKFLLSLDTLRVANRLRKSTISWGSSTLRVANRIRKSTIS
jgi:hypothetical protein